MSEWHCHGQLGLTQWHCNGIDKICFEESEFVVGVFFFKVRDTGIISIAFGCKELRVVLLNGCEGLSDQSLLLLLDHCPHLNYVTTCRTSKF